MPSIYTVTLNPASDKTVQVPNFAVDQGESHHVARDRTRRQGINVSKVIAELGGESPSPFLGRSNRQNGSLKFGENNIKGL